MYLETAGHRDYWCWPKEYLTWIPLTLSNKRTTVDQHEKETKGEYSHVEMSLKLQQMTTEHHRIPSLSSALDCKVMDSPCAGTKAKLWIVKSLMRRVAPSGLLSSHIQKGSGIIFVLKTPTKYRELFPSLFLKRTDFQLVLIWSRLVQLPYLESIVQWLIYQDG